MLWLLLGMPGGAMAQDVRFILKSGLGQSSFFSVYKINLLPSCRYKIISHLLAVVFSKTFSAVFAFLKLEAGAYVLFQSICLVPYREESGLRLCKFQGF